MISPEALTGGFTDPVFDSQAVFRKVLDALSRPGRAVPIRPFAGPPAPLLAAAAAVVATLADEATPVFLDAALAANRAVAEWIVFHTGATIVARPEAAAFAIIADAAGMPPLAAFATGSDAYPDRSTTLVLQVEALTGGPDILRLAGPGIAREEAIAPLPLPAGFVAQLAGNRALFPRGVDLLLAAPDAILGLPRAVRAAAGGG